MSHVGVRVEHDAATVAARRPRVARVLAQHVQHVAEVEADGAHVQLDLCGAEWRGERRLRLQLQAADRAARREVRAERPAGGGGNVEPREQRG